MTTGKIMTVTGVGGSVGYTGDGGSPTNALLTRPTGIAVRASGYYYIADFGNHLIRVVQPTHTCDRISNKNSTVCSGNGLCVATDTCQCHNGYGGVFCSLNNCFGVLSNESSVCSGHGACMAQSKCDCKSGFGGNDCSLNICFGVLSNETTTCSSHGNCAAPNTCDCKPGYAGDDCSSVIPTGGTIQVSPFNGTLLVTKFNLTTSNWKPVEQVTTFEYRFGVVDPSSKSDILCLNSFSASTTLMTALPIQGIDVIIVMECRSASGQVQQRNTSVVVQQSTTQDLSNYVTKHNQTLLAVNNEC